MKPGLLGSPRLGVSPPCLAVNEDAFYTILFTVLSHSSGINITPAKLKPSYGRLGEGGLAKRMLIELKVAV